ncbi:hypothetical protein [Nonomuraea sp. SYSU D8015]|uniref:hypothetical protein n=1 Tax=Nonomuraea sp. SYSU D8015 TaxID=2593644 RepID=UPI0016616AA0|nr:hypothetical protein [Nonomuraea sp. SYSU D8015]
MHENTESRQLRTRGVRRVAALTLAAAAAGVMLLPTGQGVASASSTATLGVSVSSHETPPLYCDHNYRCRYGWWRYYHPSWRYYHHPSWRHHHPGWHPGARHYYDRLHGLHAADR